MSARNARGTSRGLRAIIMVESNGDRILLTKFIKDTALDLMTALQFHLDIADFSLAHPRK